ncbi:hypothetical protein ABEB36_008756 [Hypothenemus hampei]|uniref:Uncharacterized protein n=1 Tax=Hypothenemus hampei TaxID=57062 RepID=A0ABD1EMY4_HYPHA
MKVTTFIMDEKFENCLLALWVTDMQVKKAIYREPILDEKVTSIIKLACDTFQQDVQVFFMTVDVVEEYIYRKESHQETISDPFLIICVIIFILSKYYGCGPDLNITILKTFLLKITGTSYHNLSILKSEQDVLSVLNYKLPFGTILDEMNNFFEKFMREYRLQDAVRPLCIEILVLLYCTRTKWFQNIKDLYSEDKNTFKTLISTKLYVPSAILISAFKVTNYQFILDLNGFVDDISEFTKIHSSHIYALSSIILSLMNSV